MPNMEGLEASRRIREIEYQESRGRTPIVAVTANSMPEDRDACERAGMDYFLAKPLRCEPFLNAVDQWLHCEQEREVATSANVTQVPETIDWSDLARLGRDIGPEVIPELVENFSQDLSESNALLDEYLAAGQIEDLTRLAHTPQRAQVQPLVRCRCLKVQNVLKQRLASVMKAALLPILMHSRPRLITRTLACYSAANLTKRREGKRRLLWHFARALAVM